MTKLKLKKHLAVLPKEDVMNLVLSLYDASAEAKMYLEMYLTPDYSAPLEKYKKIIRNEFFPARGFSDKPSFATCRKAISDFKKLKADAISLGDLMLYYIELGCEYTMTFGDMWEQYYTTLETNFEKALKHISDHNLENISDRELKVCLIQHNVVGDFLIPYGICTMTIMVVKSEQRDFV